MKRFFGLISKDRKIQKSLSFRVFATMGTFAVAYAFTGNFLVSAPIAGAQAITNTLIYYEHEKYWEKKEPKQPEQPKLHEYHKKYGVDNFN